MISLIQRFRHCGVLPVLIAINVVVWAVVGISIVFAKAGVGVPLTGWFALPGFPQAWLLRPWTLLTYMFTHTHPLHLLFNVLWLGWFGTILLIDTSVRRLVYIYIGGGICGGLLYMLLGRALPFGGSMLLGASASVLAIMTAAAVQQPSYPVHLFFIGDVKLKWLAIFMIFLAFLGLGGGNAGGEIAHVGGVLFGLAVAWIPKLSHAGKRPSRRKVKPKNISRVKSIMEEHRANATRLDELLDKIRVSGFESLTKAERKELDRLSKKV